MRTIHALPLVAAMLLAGCGDKAGDNGEGTVSNGVAQGMVTPQPGQYRTSLELLEFDSPGMADAVKAQMRSIMGSALTQDSTYCLTPEEAEANGPKRMAEDMAKGDCSFNTFTVSGGTLSADMQCTGDDGRTGRVLMDGQMTPTSSNVLMTMDQTIEGMGQVRMKMRAKMERIGDCA